MSITSFEPRNFSFAYQSTPKNVGPGAYNPNAKFQKYHAPIPFGSTTRRELFPQKEEYSVGPGDYDPQLQVRSSSANAYFSLGSDRKYFEDKENNPSPADYSPLNVWGRRKYSSKSSFSRPPKYEARENPYIPEEKKPLPGPGEYTPKVEQSQKAALFSYSKTPQREPVYDDGTPGPADYTIEKDSDRQKPSAVFKTKMKREIFDTKNHFDSYMLEHKAWPAAPMTKGPFGGTTKRILDFGPVETPDQVGPGAYNPKISISKPKINRGDFGVDHEFYDNLPKSNPGPGYYNTDSLSKKNGSSNRKIPNAVIPRAPKPDLWNPIITPSPGQYETYEEENIKRNSILKIKNPAFKDKSERDSLTNKDPNPGPAAYSVKNGSLSNSISRIETIHKPPLNETFSKGARFTSKNYVGSQKMNDSPSPANYSVGGGISKRAKSGFSFNKGGRFLEKPEEGPGPGKYQSSTNDNFGKKTWNVKFGYLGAVREDNDSFDNYPE
ncbi:hypothetical protein M9Y10_035127 [Tritrichomonas musculus]|uniref:Uncharacterized protein n=1 Tax=Tritrichomonas musculus TaxID=1915356 RepID=A0ABR2KHP0_9EUKA